MSLSKLIEETTQRETYCRNMAKKFKRLAILSGAVSLGALYFLDKSPTMSTFTSLTGLGFTIFDVTNYFRYNQYANYLRERHPIYFNED